MKSLMNETRYKTSIKYVKIDTKHKVLLMKESDDTFCINCFMDPHVKKYIKENGTCLGQKAHIGFICTFCESSNLMHNERYDILQSNSKKRIFFSEEIYTIPQKKLINKFIEIINLNCDFIDDRNSHAIKTESLISIITDVFYLEQTDVIGKLAKYDFINYEEFSFSESSIKDYNCGNTTDYVGYDILRLKKWSYKKDNEVFRWSSFCEHTKHKARYFDHKNIYFKPQDELKKFNSMFKKLEITVADEIVYRARSIDSKAVEEEILDAEKKGSLSELLGKAPSKIVKNNRFSPIGISYGYFSFNEQTALAEIRANKFDKIALGKFKINKPLKIIKFDNSINFKAEMDPFNKEFNLYTTNLFIVIEDFLQDISRSISSEESLLEYVPTQIMSEYICSLGYDGFIFKSSQHEDGENLVLFGDNPECNNFELVTVDKKSISYAYEVIRKSSNE